MTDKKEGFIVYEPGSKKSRWEKPKLIKSVK